MRAKLDYGIDGPDVLKTMALIGLAGTAVAGLASVVWDSRGSKKRQVAARAVGILGGVAASYGFGMSAYMIYDGRIGKVRWREQWLDQIGQSRPWTGDERVLDVGCGRGLMLIAAAGRLTDGEAVGVDVWREQDQTGNSAVATLKNAQLENVSDRVKVQTSDCRTLPFAQDSFDVVLSRWVLHNLPDQIDRSRSLDEMTRVLRRGGVLAIADIANHDEYSEALTTRGFTQMTMSCGGLATRLIGVLSGGAFRPTSLIAVLS